MAAVIMVHAEMVNDGFYGKSRPLVWGSTRSDTMMEHSLIPIGTNDAGGNGYDLGWPSCRQHGTQVYPWSLFLVGCLFKGAPYLMNFVPFEPLHHSMYCKYPSKDHINN